MKEHNSETTQNQGSNLTGMVHTLTNRKTNFCDECLTFIFPQSSRFWNAGGHQLLTNCFLLKDCWFVCNLQEIEFTFI